MKFKFLGLILTVVFGGLFAEAPKAWIGGGDGGPAMEDYPIDPAAVDDVSLAL